MRSMIAREQDAAGVNESQSKDSREKTLNAGSLTLRCRCTPRRDGTCRAKE